MTERCVFCGHPITADEPRAGRGQAAAHARCADRALADDAHWDAIAESSAEGHAEERSAPRRGGCLAIVAITLIVALVLAAAAGFAPV